MEWINAHALQYAEQNCTVPDVLLMEIEQQAKAMHPEPHMVSGHVQGVFLRMISQMIHPRYVLEIGTMWGYSALCLAAGLQHEGELHTIESRASDAETAKRYISRSPFAQKITVHVGQALDVMESLKKTWDLVFIDADKINYVRYYELAMEQLSTGGFILADNVLFHGQVLEKEIKGKNAKAIHDFNTWVSADPRVETCLLTVRDGLMLIRKK